MAFCLIINKKFVSHTTMSSTPPLEEKSTEPGLQNTGGPCPKPKEDDEPLLSTAEMFRLLTKDGLNHMTPTDVLTWCAIPVRGTYAQQQMTTAARLLYQANPTYYNEIFKEMGLAITPPAPGAATDCYLIWSIPPIPDELINSTTKNLAYLKKKKEELEAAETHQRQTSAKIRAEKAAAKAANQRAKASSSSSSSSTSSTI